MFFQKYTRTCPKRFFPLGAPPTYQISEEFSRNFPEDTVYPEIINNK